MKTCTKCKEEKSLDQFHKDKRALSGTQSRCKECQREDKKVLSLYYREHHLLSKYGIDLEGYDNLLKSQNSQCRVCGIEEKYCENSRLAVDHNHETGGVRGLLCKKCNQAIGLLQDNPDNCVAAAEYLKEEGHYGRS